MREKVIKAVLGLTVFGISFAVYVYTLCPAISAGDSTEIVNVGLILGVPHQPSYPFVVLLGNLFGRLPFGPSLAWRVNLFSAFFEALTGMMAYFIVIKLFRMVEAHNTKYIPSTPSSSEESRSLPRHLGGVLKNKELRIKNKEDEGWKTEDGFGYFLAAAASLFLSFSLTFWQYGTKAEVFALNNFFAAVLLLLALTFAEKKKTIWFYLLVFFAALAFTHHQTQVLLGPTLLFLVWPARKQILTGKKNWGKILSLIFLGFLPYCLLLWFLARRNPPLNWGSADSLPAIFRALVRADFGTFASSLKEGQTMAGETPVDQIVFYAKSLVDDFTLLGMALAVLGGVFLWRRTRKIFWLLGSGFLSGVAFLSYADFPLSGGFNQATVKRFQLLPDLFFSFFLGFGLYFLWQEFEKIKLDYSQKMNQVGRGLLFLVFGFSFIVPLGMNFGKANNKDNWGVWRYGRDFYLPTEPNAIIMLVGDVSNFVGQYMGTTQTEKNERISFSSGQFHLEWFLPQLKKRYPDLEIPPPLPGHRFTIAPAIIRANLDKRPIYISPELVSFYPEIEKEFVLWPKGLLFKVEKKGREKKLEPYREESQRLWQSLDLNWFIKVKKNDPTFEGVIVDYYARHFHNLGYMFDSVKLYEDAIREYKRALQIDPFLAESLKNIGLIYGLKLKPANYQAAVDYLSKYISVVEKSDPDLADAGRSTIYQIAQIQQKEIQELLAREASASAENKEATPSGGEK